MNDTEAIAIRLHGGQLNGLSLRERFDLQHEKTDACWIWKGTRERKGYGRLNRGGRTGQLLAHRAAYELFIGPIPEGMMVCHRCDVPYCVNPDHLFIGTAKDNAMDEVAKGRNPHANKTICLRGHAYDEQNTYRHPRGHRACRLCQRDRMRERRSQ